MRSPVSALTGKVPAILIWALTALLIGVLPTPAPASQLGDNLEGHWSFDEGSGSTVHDLSVNGLDGAISSAWWVRDPMGQSGKALWFGESSSVTVPYGEAMNIEGPFSVSAWVNPEDVNEGQTRVIASRSQGAGQFSWALIQDGSSVRFRVSADGTWDGNAADGEVVLWFGLSAGQWTHLTGVWDGAGLFLYKNGENMFASIPWVQQPFWGTAPLTIGTGSGHFLGAIDDVRLYSAALDAAGAREAAGLTSLIRGRLVRDDERPVTFGWVTAIHDSGFWLSAISDAAGDYTIYTLPGCYRVSATALPGEDYATPAPVCLYAMDGALGGSIADFYYESGGHTVSGRLLADGQGLSDVAIGYQSDAGLNVIAMSDASGFYTLTNLPSGNGSVKAYLFEGQWALASRQIDLSADVSGFDIILSPGATVSGVVVSSDGLPVAGAAVSYHSKKHDVDRTVETGLDGSFVLSCLPEGLADITAVPGEDSTLCASSEYIVNLLSGQNLAMGAIRLLKGAVVTGLVTGEFGENLSCIEVGADGLDFSAWAKACDGRYRLRLPVGTHFLSADPDYGWGGSSSCTVAVTVTAMDVAEQLLVNASDLAVHFGETSGSVQATVPANPAWVTPSEGGLYVVAFAQGLLTTPVEADDIARIQPNQEAEILSQPGEALLAPLCPGTYDIYLVWNVATPERPDQVTVLDKALGILVEGGSQTPVALDLPGADVTRATGSVYDDNGNPVVGATVFLTDANGGLAGYAITDGFGNYTLQGLAASVDGILYTVTARLPGGGQAQKSFLATSGGITEIPSLDLPYYDVMNLTVRKNFHVETTLDYFDGAANPNLPVQPRGEVWFGRPLGGQDQIQLPDVDWMAGRSVENVFAQHMYMPMYGGPQNEALPPGEVENPNTATSRYKWTDLPSLAADVDQMGVTAVSSNAVAVSMPFAVTRTFDGPAQAGPYQRWVTVEVAVNDTGIARLDIDIFDRDSPIAQADFNAQGGLMEGGVPVDSENYQSLPGFFRRSVDNPVQGQVYVYRKLLDITPRQANGAVEYVPETRVRAVRPGNAVQTDIDGNTITLTDPTGIGVIAITPENAIDWQTSGVASQVVHELVQTLFVSDPAATRPTAIDVPMAGVENASVGSNVEIVFNKSMDTASVGLRLEDQWGNVVHDSWRNIVGGIIGWNSGVLSDDTLTFSPNEAFKPGTAYKVSWFGRDAAGYPPLGGIEGNFFTFSTAKGADTVSPYVVSTLPADGAIEVPVSMARKGNGNWITAFMNEAVKASLLNGNVLLEALDGPGGNAVENIQANVSGFGHRIMILPENNLSSYTWYRATIATGVRDLAGLAPEAEYSWEFVTGATFELPPEFSTPIAGATDVDPANPVIILYPDRDLDPASLVPGSIVVEDGHGNDISGFFDIEYRRPDHGIALVKKPQMNFARLEPGETYTISVTHQVKDLSGNAGEVDYSFTTAAGFANKKPQFRRVTTGGGPWPDLTKTPSGYFIGLDVQATDRDLGWPGETFMVEGSLSDATFTLNITTESPYLGPGDFLASYRTPLNSPIAITGGNHNLGLTMIDSAENFDIMGRVVKVFDQVPELLSPTDNGITGWPPKLTFNGIPGAKAYVVQVFSSVDIGSMIGSFPVADDGRSGSYSLTLPGDLAFESLAGWWRVSALGGLDAMEPWGRAVSEVRRFVKDTTAPFLFSSDPSDGSSAVGTTPLIRLTVADADSAIKLDSIAVWLDNVPVPGASLSMDAADPKNVVVSFTPSPALTIGSAHSVRIYCRDGAANPIAGDDTVNFTVRENATFEVPGQYPTITAALDAATGGDTVLVHPGTYRETLELGERHSGIRLAGVNPETTVIEGNANLAVVTFFGTDNFILKGFTIINGGVAGVEISAHSQGTTGNTISGCRITENIGDGVLITANEANALENNLIFWNGVSGVYAYDQDTGDAGLPRPVIIFNTITDNNYDGVNLANCDAKVFYNILAVNGRYGVNRLSGSPALGRNIVWGNDDGEYFGIGMGEGDIAFDPMFVDRDYGDYRPGPTSPAKDALDPAPLVDEPLYVGVDIRGVNRPVGGRFDIGCFELRDFLTAPVPKVAAPLYYAMEGRPFCLEFAASWETAVDPLDFSLLGTVPAGLTFNQPVFGASPAIVNWTPVTGTAGTSTVLTPSVTAGNATAEGQAFTITVVPALTLSPMSGTAFLYGATPSPLELNITGGTPPYSVALASGAGTVASLTGLVDGKTFGAFSLVPLSPTGDGVDPALIRITDSTPAAPETFSLVSGPFEVALLNTSPVTTMPVANPAVDSSFNIGSGDLLGWSFFVPAGAAPAPFDLTAARVLLGSPYLFENSTLKALVQPEGMAFSQNVVVGVPVTHLVDEGAILNNLVALTYDSVKSRWTGLPITGRDSTPGSERVTFTTPHFSLFTVAEPSTFTRTLAAGATVADYRMVCFPAFAATSENLTGILADPANLGAYDDRMWRLFGVDNALIAGGNPNEYYVEGDAAGFGGRFPLEAGRAFWAISRAEKTVSVPGLAVSPDPFYIRLIPGWNMIGNPFPREMNWSAVERSLDGQTFVTPSDAYGADPLSGEPLYDYDPPNAEPGDGGYVVTSLMKSNTGYFVYNPQKQDVIIRISVPAFGELVGANEKDIFMARALRLISRGVSSAFASTLNRTPPSPPGIDGANAGSPDAIGAGSVASGSTCFVETVAKNSPGACWLLALAILAAIAGAGIARGKSGRG